jgi:hypothetical protein
MSIPPPQYQDPPANLRPLYYENQDGTEMQERYPFKHAKPQGENPCAGTSKRSFWRTKTGIILIVLLSNAIILAAVLGGIFASFHARHHSRQSDYRDFPGAVPQEPEPGYPSTDSSGSDFSNSPSSFDPPSFSPSQLVSTSFASTKPVATSTPTGAPQAGVNGDSTTNEGQGPVAATGVVATAGPRNPSGGGTGHG